MSKTSTAAKYRYNKKTYKQFNVQIKPDLFNQITEFCTSNGLSRAEFLKLAISTLTNSK